ncbi:MAG: cupin domain-containing protein [Paracoccaceae bacterium]
MTQNAQSIIKTLGMIPHPEGGWYVETWRSTDGPRPSGSAIYFLLEADQRSHWHRIDSAEIWHWYAGSPLELRIYENGATKLNILGPDLPANQRPQRIVPPSAWQSAAPIGGWVLVGCTVSPAFTFDTFELAPEGWVPG